MTAASDGMAAVARAALGERDGRLRIAIPNKGRLLEPTLALLRDAGLGVPEATRALFARVEDQPIDILFVRTDDIAAFVADGVADLGITGWNLVVEAGVDVPVRLELGYGRCRLAAAVPVDHPATELADLDGLRIATSHPASARRLLAEHGARVEVVPVGGAVEVAPRLGLADAIVDLVSSGSTLAMNGLRTIGDLVRSEAVVVGAPSPDPVRAGIADELLMMLGAVIAGRRVKYLMMNAPVAALPEIESILPGLESPSVIPLAHAGMAAVHAVVGTRDVAGLLPRLKAAGASGILVIPVEKLLP